MLITRTPLMDVTAVAGTSVLNIFLVLRINEKHKNTWQGFAKTQNVRLTQAKTTHLPARGS